MITRRSIPWRTAGLPPPPIEEMIETILARLLKAFRQEPIELPFTTAEQKAGSKIVHDLMIEYLCQFEYSDEDHFRRVANEVFDGLMALPEGGDPKPN